MTRVGSRQYNGKEDTLGLVAVPLVFENLIMMVTLSNRNQLMRRRVQVVGGYIIHIYSNDLGIDPILYFHSQPIENFSLSGKYISSFNQ